MNRFKRFWKVAKNPEYIPSYWRKLVRGFTFFDFDYMFLDGYSFAPQSVCFILTEKCNLKCVMCDIGQRNAHMSSQTPFPIAESIRKGNEMMTLEEWKTLVDDIVAKRWKTLLLLTGTEPFMYEHTLELVEYIVANNLRVHITTNGTHLYKHADALVDLCKKPDTITITLSLDGIGEVHDTIRGVKGTFDKAIDGLKKLNTEKKKFGRGWPVVNITYTVSNYNFRNMRSFVQWFHAHDMAIGCITFSHLWFKDKAIVHKHNERYGGSFAVQQENLNGLNISDIDMDFVHRELRAIQKVYAKSAFSIVEHPRLTFEEAKKYYAKATDSVFYNKCLAPWRNVAITPKGEVIVSPMCFDSPLGSVKKNSFSHIWNDTPLKTFRKKLKKVGMYPACVRCCLLFDSKPKYYKLKDLI